MTVKVAKTAIGHKSGDTVSLSFKWADNADVRGDVMRFMELGDTAPNDRFVFAYTASTLDDERGKSDEPVEDTTSDETTPVETAPVETDSVIETTAPEATTSTSADTSVTEEKKGCRSALGVSGCAMVAVALGTVSCMKRKKER